MDVLLLQENMFEYGSWCWERFQIQLGCLETREVGDNYGNSSVAGFSLESYQNQLNHSRNEGGIHKCALCQVDIEFCLEAALFCHIFNSTIQFYPKGWIDFHELY